MKRRRSPESRVNSRRPDGVWRDPSTGEELPVYDPGRPLVPGEAEELALEEAVRAKREADPGYRLQKFLEEKKRREEEEKRIASPEYQENVIAPLERRKAAIAAEALQVVHDAFSLVGEVESETSEKKRPVRYLDDNMERYGELGKEYKKVQIELYRARGQWVPEEIPGLPVRRIGVDCSAYALIWLNEIAMAGHLAYIGHRKFPPLHLPATRRG